MKKKTRVKENTDHLKGGTVEDSSCDIECIM